MAVNKIYAVPNFNSSNPPVFFGGAVDAQEDVIYVWPATYTVPAGGLYYLKEFGVGYIYYTGDATHMQIRLEITSGSDTAVIPLHLDYVAGTTRAEGTVKSTDIGFTEPLYLPAGTTIKCVITFGEATAIAPTLARAYFWGNIYNYYTA